MYRGVEMYSPDGFGPMQPNESYFYFGENDEQNRLLFVYFTIREKKSPKQSPDQGPTLRTITADLVELKKTEFVRAQGGGYVLRRDQSSLHPPWLENGYSFNLKVGERYPGTLGHKEQKRYSAYTAQIEKRYEAISELLPLSKKLLLECPSAQELRKAIHAHGKTIRPAKNGARVRTWFLTYLVFQEHKHALQFSTDRIGKNANRSALSMRKTGNKTGNASKTPWRVSNDAKQKIKSHFLKHANHLTTYDELYARVLVEEFGCVAKKVENHNGNISYEPHNENGDPFPSESAWKYWIRKLINANQLNEIRHGYNYTRNRLAPEKGSVLEHVGKLYERIEADARVIDVAPMSDIQNESTPTLWFTTRVDVLSGRITGVGPGYGGENSDSYRVAAFCEAVGFAKFAKLMDIQTDLLTTIDQEGAVALQVVTDRGPGSTEGARARSGHGDTSIHTSGPVNRPQDRPHGESAHSKSLKEHAEKKNRLGSGLTVYETFKKEFLNALGHNARADKVGILPPALIGIVTPPTPNNLWAYYASRNRDVGRRISFDNAVRQFLPKLPGSIDKHGLLVEVNTYAIHRHPELLRGLSKGQQRPVDVYVIPMCPLHVWVESPDPPHRLIQLRIFHKAEVESGTKPLPMLEAKEKSAQKRLSRTESRLNRHGVNVAIFNDLESNIGRSYRVEPTATRKKRKSPGYQEKKRAMKEAGLTNAKK